MSTKLKMSLPVDSAARKDMPITTGVLDYFPAAIAAIARLSKRGNDKHNPGQPLHWSRGKSQDHADCIPRHLIDRGAIDPDTGEYHEVMLAWRALALLQLAEEARGAPLARGSRVADEGPKPLAWDEGWRCICGSTEVWRNYTEATLIEKPARGRSGPLCNNINCFSRMVSDGQR